MTDHPQSHLLPWGPSPRHEDTADRGARWGSPGARGDIQYDLPSGDAFGTSVGAIVRQTVNGAQHGSIIVMHITGGNTAPLTDQALPQIVTGLRARGFELVKVSDLLASPGV
jgi:peptidoglycan/xylan/chitin deacetylase (PgdA/CDA1 family)